MPVKAVVFDIGNVLVGWSPRLLYAKLIPDPAELDWFLDNVVTIEWHTQHDCGLPLDEGVRQRSEEFPEHASLIAAFRDRWRETITGPIEDSVALVRALKARGVPLYVITNYSAETFPDLVAEFDFMALFDDVVVSGREGVVKPDARIFEIAKARFGLAGPEALFIDDRVENVEAAERAGFAAHLFRDAAGLEARLRSLGLL